MSKKDAVPLHIEWTPGWVRAVNIATGDRAEAVTLKKLGAITSGHKEAIIGIGRKIVFLKAVRLPKALPDDLRRIIGVQLGQYFPLAADQLSFDFIQTPNQTQDGFLTIVGAFKAEDLRLLQSELKEVGITPRRILPIALAASVAAAKSGNVDALVIELDRGDIALDVVQGSFLRFSRLTPVGSDIDIESQRTLAAAGAGDIPIVRIGEDSGSLTAGDSTLTLLHEAPPFNFELSESRVLHVKQRIAMRTRIAVMITLFAIAVSGTVILQQQQDQAKFDAARAQGQKSLSGLQSRETDESAVTEQLKSLQTDLSRAFKPGQQLSDISAFVSDSLPSGAWLTGLTVERAHQVEVRGTAMTSGEVASFVDTLGSSPRFANVKLIFANSALIGTAQVIQFNVTADCVGNLPMPAPEKDTGNVRTASSSSPDESTEGGG
jgi:Tfp pilus assembly protein PilN